MKHDAANVTRNKIQASYTLEGTVLEDVEIINYLGETITCDLKWNTHIRNVCTKANRTLGFLRQTHYNGLNDELENVQERADRFVTRNYSRETGSKTGILEELK